MTTWTARIRQEHRAGNLTSSAVLVLEELAAYASGSRGEAWPSHATLASRAGTSISTVQRALRAARDLGLIEWTERRVRAGWRWLRTSNLYRFIMPAAAVIRTKIRHPRTTGLFARREESQFKKAAQEAQVGGRFAGWVMPEVPEWVRMARASL